MVCSVLCLVTLAYHTADRVETCAYNTGVYVVLTLSVAFRAIVDATVAATDRHSSC